MKCRGQSLASGRPAGNWRDTAGVYPLTAIPVALGWQRWQVEHLPPFRKPTAEVGFEGVPVLYLPELELAAASAQEVTAILERSRDNALGLPEPEGEDLESLAASCAPAYLVDTVLPADRIGHPVWLEDRVPGVDTTRPVEFVRTAQTWFDGKPTLQLVCIIWFRARPKENPLDIQGGRPGRLGLARFVRPGRHAAGLQFDTPVRLLSPVLPRARRGTDASARKPSGGHPRDGDRAPAGTSGRSGRPARSAPGCELALPHWAARKRARPAREELSPGHR